MVEKKDYKDGRNEKWRSVGVVWALGIQFAGAVVACVIIGYYLDRYLGTAPLMLFFFTIAGFAGGILTFYKAIKGLSKKNGRY